MAAFCGVIVDHVQNHFNSGSVQLANGGLELFEHYLGALRPASLSGITHVGCEVID